MGLPAYRDALYVVHMTLVYSPTLEAVERAKKMVNQMDFGPGFYAEAGHLTGRVAHAWAAIGNELRASSWTDRCFDISESVA